eukprot:6886398-Alexandrium_andersonii.AAC.1
MDAGAALPGPRQRACGSLRAYHTCPARPPAHKLRRLRVAGGIGVASPASPSPELAEIIRPSWRPLPRPSLSRLRSPSPL